MNEFEGAKRNATVDLEGDVWGNTWYHLHTARLELITTNRAQIRASIDTGLVPFYNKRSDGGLRKVYRKLKYVERETKDGGLELVYKNNE